MRPPSGLSRTIALRLLGALLVALTVAAATAAWLVERSDRAARARQLEDAAAHVRVRMADLEDAWQILAAQVLAQLDFTRLLDHPSTRDDRLTALLASFSGTLVFSQVFLVDATGAPIYRYRVGSGQPSAPPSGLSATSGWLHSIEDRTVYRVLAMPVVAMNQKGLRLVLLVPVDRAVLLGSAYPGADVYLAWRGRVLTGSTPEPVGGSEAELLAGPWDRPAAALPWGDDPDAPHLIVRRTFDPPTDWREAVAALAIAGILLGVLGWLAIGQWLSHIRNRVRALKTAADLFRGGGAGTEAAIADRIAVARGAGDRGDELSGLAEALAATMRERRAAEEALRQSEAKFSGAFKVSPDIVTISRLPDGVLVEVNEAFEAATGHGRAEAIGRTAVSLGLWPRIEQRQALIAALDRDGISRNAEFTMRTRGGELRTCLVNAARFDTGGERYMLGITRDITETNRAAEALRENEARLREAQRIARLGSWELDIRAGRLNWSDEVFRIFEIDPERFEASYEAFLGLVYPEDRAAVDWAYRRSVETRAPYEITVRLLMPDGRIKHVRERGETRYEDGRPVMSIGTMQDVTELLQAEAALRQSEAMFSAMFHESPVPLAVTRYADSLYLDMNQAWLDMFGYRREEVIGRTSMEIGLYDDPSDREGIRDQIRMQGRADRYELVFRRKDGEARVCQISGKAFDLNGTRSLLWGVIDITDLRRAQQQVEALNTRLEQRVDERTRELGSALETLRRAQQEIVRSEKLAALGALVAGVAHELNTPIGNCVTVASTLKDRGIEFERTAASGTVRRSALKEFVEQSRTGADILLRSLQRAAQLVASFKQVAADQSSEQRRPFDLLTSLEEVREMLAPTIRLRACRLDLDVPPGIALDSYPGPLGQVVTNLVTNAITHGFEGRPGGCMALAARALGTDRVELLFSDDGRGIAPEHLGRIFDPFFTTRLGQGGSGLGLHIVYNLTTGILGGTIDVESAPGKGARFRIVLPVAAPRASEAAAEAIDG